MTKDKKTIGTVIEQSKNALYTVQLENGDEIKCILKGKLRIKRINVLVGDKVEVDIIPNSEKHYIVYRM